MTQKEIQLLLKDLSARLPYGVMCQVDDGVAGLNDGKLIEIDVSKEIVRFDADYYWDAYIDDVKPYLRPMSSMTKEEKLHVELTYGFFYHNGVLDNVHIFEAGGIYDRDGNYDPPCEYRQEKHVTIEQVLDFIHWLNANHFAYRTIDGKDMFELGIALKAPEGMYK